MNKNSIIFSFAAAVALSWNVCASAQMNVANFENGVEQGSTISLASTNSSLFSTPPSVMLNPLRDGINSSAKCLGAVNVANADWYGNVVSLKLTEAVKVDYDHRFLSFLMLRGEQPKNFRVGINGYEEANQVYLEKLASTCQWELGWYDPCAQHRVRQPGPYH